MRVSGSTSAGADAVQLLVLRKQLDVQQSAGAQLLEGLARTVAAAAPPARPAPPAGTWYL